MERQIKIKMSQIKIKFKKKILSPSLLQDLQAQIINEMIVKGVDRRVKTLQRKYTSTMIKVKKGLNHNLLDDLFKSSAISLVMVEAKKILEWKREKEMQEKRAAEIEAARLQKIKEEQEK